MKKSINRRELLAGFTALAGMRLLPASIPASLALMPTAAQANPWAAASLGLTVATTIMGMNAKGGGLGEQFAALNLKLDQVLKNQIYTMEAIGVLQSSIDELDEVVSGLLVKERFKNLLSRTEALKDNTESLLAAINPETNPGFVMNAAKTDDYFDYARELRTLTSMMNTEIAIAPLKKQDVQLNGPGILLTLAPPLLTLIALMDSFRSVKNTHPDLRLESIEYIRMVTELKEALTTLKEKRIPEAIAVQIEEANEAVKVLDQAHFWSPMSSVFPGTNKIPGFDEPWPEDPPARVYCSKPVQYTWHHSIPESGFHYYWYRLMLILNYTYNATHMPGVKPNEYVYTDLNLPLVDEAIEWPHELNGPLFRMKSRPHEEKDFMNLPRPELPAGCEENLALIYAENSLSKARPDASAIINGFNTMVSGLPRYNNALTFQYQMLSLIQLCDVLQKALDKFETAVAADINPTPKLQTLTPKP